ncbi:TonB-dependent receptor plug domain-containing protein [Paracoccus sp. 1_MG-2023]|uniref:TonB-dependent receptor plug domain-containing protein n=1 Tax=unclassified Paracoccus (in: a-proteobacteria) TaxID=2688777 RepID=UPI001C08B24F|nr:MULTISPECIES: TonB-dependent receptor plug domain-containing protein [unclassified Paracoccus (in: a-proteobacteria)]MBU2956096.1 TonB-dependent receptor plug domain-containing protein [Paracoccus sp. C2R09]MDO6669502.1 TonB-dependent receptor plug domain-containing protein [Paracoccus sp. 1_MG-2023]
MLEGIVLTAEEQAALGRVEIGAERLEDVASGSLDDVFAEEPAVSVGGGMPLTEQVFVNGIDQQQLAVSVDGAPQNNSLFHHTGTNVVDPGLLKAVRVDPGVAGADAGPYALAGSIAYETKSAIDLLQPGQSFGGKVVTGYADNGNTATGALTLYGRQGPVDALVYVRRDSGDDYEDGAGNEVANTGADLNSAMVKLGADLGDWRAELGLTRIEDDALRPYRANIDGVLGGTNDPRRYELIQTTETLSLKKANDGGPWNPEFRLSKSENEVNTFDLATDGETDPDFNLGTASTVSMVAQNVNEWNGIEFTTGIDVQNRKGVYDGQYGGTDYGFREDTHNTGIFTQARGSVDRFDFGAGLRYDWNEFTGANGQQIDTDGASVNASVTWHATNELSFSGAYSSVFGGVGLASVYDLWTNYADDGAYDDLEAVRAQNAILGVAWERGGTVLGGDLFSTKLNNARKYLGTVDAETEGYRLFVSQEWQGGSASLRYTDTDVEIDGSGTTTFYLRDLGMIPGRMLTLQVKQDVTPEIQLGGIVEHVFEEDGQGDATSDLDRYTVVDVFAEYAPAQYENVTFRAEIGNLFDQDYVDRASYGGDYDSVLGQSEPGRTIAISASVKF